MLKIKPMEYEDCKNIVDWNSDKEEDYLYQWTGHKTYSYPLNLDQVVSRLSEENTIIFKILLDDYMIGCVELSCIDKSKGVDSQIKPALIFKLFQLDRYMLSHIRPAQY